MHGVFIIKKHLILDCYINLTPACSQYQNKWICDETWYRLLNAHYPTLKKTFDFLCEELNRILTDNAGPCTDPNKLSLFVAKFSTEYPFSDQKRRVSYYFRQVNGKPPSDPKYAVDVRVCVDLLTGGESLCHNWISTQRPVLSPHLEAALNKIKDLPHIK